MTDPLTPVLTETWDVEQAFRGAFVSEDLPRLMRLYDEALRIAGRQCRQVDGEEAFLAGATKIVEMLE